MELGTLFSHSAPPTLAGCVCRALLCTLTSCVFCNARPSRGVWEALSFELLHHSLAAPRTCCVWAAALALGVSGVLPCQVLACSQASSLRFRRPTVFLRKSCSFWWSLTYTVQFSSVVSNYLWPPWTACPSPTPGVHSNSCPLSQWCHPSNHLILWRPLLLLPSVFPSIRVFSDESALCIRWPVCYVQDYFMGWR